MKSICKSFVWATVLLLATANINAQQTKQFTLEELIPGGKDFYHFYPRLPIQYQWQGDKLISIKNDSVWVTENPQNPDKQTFLFSYDYLQQTLPKEQQGEIYQVNFPETQVLVIFYGSKGIGLYGLKDKKAVGFFAFPEKSENHQLSPLNTFLAYTIDNNLYVLDRAGKQTAVSNETNKGIVYGQAVHRNEFGIDGGIFWSPKGNKLAFYRMDETMVTDYPLVDISARIAQLKNIKYPMAGMTSHEVTIGVFDPNTQTIVYLKTRGPKDLYLTNVAWSPDEQFIYVAELNREQNHLQLNRYNATTGDFDKTLFEETDSRYVEPQHPVMFVANHPDRFVWQSRRDGYNHLYLYDISGKLLKQLTHGEWEVTEVKGFDAKGENLFFESTYPAPMDRHLFVINLNSGKMQQLTTESGMHNGTISISGLYLLDRFSSNDNPGKIYLINMRNKKTTLLSAAKNPFQDYNIPTVESGTIKAADNKTDLYYRLVKPHDFDPSKKYPTIIYVYGGPHSQMVQNRWRYGSGGWEMYMAQRGYLVFVMDNRGTSYRGDEFEKATFRHLGVEEAKDQMKGVEFLKSLPYVDANRLGIHGWSFGGFMTINMLLRNPDVFKAGVAGGPVIDWKYYEVMYGERYMDTPQENPDGYRESSLLNKADQLKSRLLIIHGDEDPTVVWQNSLQFLKSCIQNGTHPDYFVYPGHGHNMMGHDRVHLHEHITRYFDDFCK
jgi:dipeptidyl-peptidase-4